MHQLEYSQCQSINQPTNQSTSQIHGIKLKEYLQKRGEGGGCPPTLLPPSPGRASASTLLLVRRDGMACLAVSVFTFLAFAAQPKFLVPVPPLSLLSLPPLPSSCLSHPFILHTHTRDSLYQSSRLLLLLQHRTAILSRTRYLQQQRSSHHHHHLPLALALPTFT
jgi:hypothetical protein